MKRSELIFTALLLPLDLLMVVLAFLAAYGLRINLGAVASGWPFEQYLTFVGLLAPFWIPIFALAGLYTLKKNRRPWEEFGSIFVGVSGGTFLVIAWPFLTRQEFFSRLIVIYLFVLAVAFVTLGRALIRSLKEYLYRYGIGVHRVLVIGTNGAAAQLVRELRARRDLGARVIGLVKSRDDAEIHSTLRDLPILGLAKDIETVLADRAADDLLIADVSLAQTTTLAVLEAAEERGIALKLSPSLLDVHATRIDLAELAGIPLLEYKQTPLEGWGMIAKRAMDIMISAILIVVTAPLALVAAIAIKLDSRGPIFFSQLDDGSPTLRIGQHNRPFRYFKFRTMVPGTHSLRYTELKHLNTRRGPLVKIKDDPRVTRIGRWLRRYSVDELSELFLVLWGKMSLVGPRPHLPEEVEKYQTRHRRVLMLKPGITGMAQISGRSDLDFEDEVRLDTYYIENWSLWLDLQILLQTPLAVMRRRQRAAD